MVELSVKEQEIYRQIEREAVGAMKSKQSEPDEVLVWLLRLRQASSDPRLLLGRRATLRLLASAQPHHPFPRLESLPASCHLCNCSISLNGADGVRRSRPVKLVTVNRDGS